MPNEDLALLEELEDRIDLEAARRALRDKEPAIAWDAMKRELGIYRVDDQTLLIQVLSVGHRRDV